MSILPLVLLAVLIDLPVVEVETLKGERHSGSLAAIGDSSLRLQTADAAVDMPLADVLDIRFHGAAVPDPLVGPRVVLIDGTRLTCQDFSIQGGQAHLAETSQCGTIDVPISYLAEVRFGISTAKLDEGWKELSAKESKTDLLVLKKEDVLDFLGGVTGDVGDKIDFLLDGDEVPVAREKVYGIVFHRKTPKLAKAACQIHLSGGDVLQAYKLNWRPEAHQVRLAAAIDVKLGPKDVTSIDYSAGKIRYLSQLEPRDVKFVPFWDPMSYREYRRDRSLDGTPLSLGGKTYARGLAINSKTTLRYRIAGEYSRFQALIGIDDSVRMYGNVRVVISGDGKPLFESEVKGTDAPRKLDLDVAGVRDLEILVDFGNQENVGDHLDLADAKLLK
ncbi:MAG: hypothetical protein EXS05_00465 [Planctomycetaceae bacterium]|nr:hypothetical protein [Planctomycetaceae bacterium]